MPWATGQPSNSGCSDGGQTANNAKPKNCEDARKTTRPNMKLSPTDATGTTQLCADRHVQDGQRPRTLQSPLWARGYNLRESARQLCIGDSTPSPTSAPPVTGATFTVDGTQIAPTRPYCNGGGPPNNNKYQMVTFGASTSSTGVQIIAFI